MAFRSGIDLQNDNIRVTQSSLRFGPLTMERVASVPLDSEGRIGDIVIVDDSKGPGPELPINRVPTTVGLYQKNTSGTWVPIAIPDDLDQNVLTVSTNPEDGQFSSIKAAVDSVTTNSATNRFIVQVLPGIYVEDTVVMKPFVSVVGLAFGASDVVVEPTSPDQTIFRLAQSSEISSMIIRGASTSGTRAVEAIDVGTNTSFINFCSFEDNAIHLSLHATAGPSRVTMRRCTFVLDAVTEVGMEISASGGNSALVTITSCSWTGIAAPNLQDVTTLTGTTARLVFDSFFFTVVTPNATANGIRVGNGATLSIGTGIIENFNYNMFIENVGAGPIVSATGITLRGGVTLDLNIEHPGATGNLTGSINLLNSFIDPSSNFSILFVSPDPTEKGLATVGPLFIGRNSSTIVDIEDSLLESLPLGVVEGGELSDGGVFDLDITAGFGYAKESTAVGSQLHRVEWANQTITLPSNESNYIMVDVDGNIFTTTASPNLITAIELGRVITNNVNIKAISRVPGVANHTTSQLDRALRDAIGPIYTTGSLVMENGVTNRALDVSSGTYFLSYLRFDPSGGTPITFSQVSHSAGTFVFLDNETQVNNTQYDDGTNLVALTAGFFAKHSLYLSGEAGNERYFLVISQDEYADQITAEAANIPSPPSSFFGSVVLIATIVVQEGNDNIVQIFDERPTLSFTASTISASSNHGNLFGLLDDDHPQYLLVDGSRALTGNLNLNGSNIINVGLLNGITVEAHAARHLPNGADAITTAAPTTALSAATTNTVGIQNSLARSDHSHEITGFQETITWEDEDVTVGGGTFTNINFVGDNITATDAGAGQLDVTVSNPQVISATIPAVTDTTLIPFDNTVPLVSEGTQIVSAAITPQATSSRVKLSFHISWEYSAQTADIAVTVYRGSTLIGMTVDSIVGGGAVNPTNTLRNVSVNLIDSPNTTSATTYSVRVGGSVAGTWRVNNDAGGNNFGGSLPSDFILEEILG